VRGPLDPIGDANINDAHGYTEITLDMMRSWMGYESLDGNGYLVKSLVHYDKDYDNAHWDGEYVAYGDGAEIFLPASGSLDVVAHEMNHGFTEFHSNLTYDAQSGGLNESFSDVAGTIAEFYEQGDSADWTFGEDTNIAEGAADRDLCDPTSRGSIDHFDDYADGVDVHSSSGIANKAFCLAVGRQLATGASHVEAMITLGRVWYLANAVFWTSESGFSQGCQGTVDAARMFGLPSETIEAIHQSWADVGVYCESGLGLACDADGLCDGGEGETCYSCPTDCGSCSEDCSWWKEMKCDLGIGDCSGCDHGGSPCGDGECNEDETDGNCGQDCGCRAPGDNCDSIAPYGCWCDSECEAYGDCCADIDVCL